jgi:hypothetical protein
MVIVSGRQAWRRLGEYVRRLSGATLSVLVEDGPAVVEEEATLDGAGVAEP